VLLAIKILHEIVHWLYYHLVGKLNSNMDTPATPIQRAESGNGFEVLAFNFIMEHEEDSATFRVFKVFYDSMSHSLTLISQEYFSQKLHDLIAFESVQR
jgi:hypothetical protein